MQKLNKYLIWVGLLILGAGFLYDVMFAGIPYQDAPDYLAIEYNRHKSIADYTMMIGLVVTVAGVVLRIIPRKSTFKTTIKRW